MIARWYDGVCGIMASLEEQKPFDLATLLKQLLSSEAPLAVRVDAASKLADVPDEPQPVHALLSILQQETDPRLVMHVINLLARKKIYSAIMPLIDLVLCNGESAIERTHTDFAKTDTGMRVRVAAIQALGRMGDERAIVPLMSILSNMQENYRLRLSAAESLGRLGDTQALNPLLNIIQDDHEPSHYLKESAVKALGMLGDIRALDPLLEIFEAQKGLKNKFNFLKEQIVKTLGRLGSNQNRVLRVLIQSLEDKAPSIRLSAVESLEEIGDASCIPILKQCLFDTDDDVARAAAAALFEIGGEALVRETLLELENLPQFIRETLEFYVS